MKNYLDLAQKVLNTGVEKEDRTGTGTISTFGEMLKFDLSKGFPLITTKKVSFHSVAHELLWFISGSTSINDLHKNNVHIWDEWADENGDLGPVYGKQWRDSRFYAKNSGVPYSIDQLSESISLIKHDPGSRRIVVNSWQLPDTVGMSIPPCHFAFVFNIINGRLSCAFHMRSTDVFLGLPFNIASYALLVHMICAIVDIDLVPGHLVAHLDDVHIYKNHIDQVNEQLTRKPHALPNLEIRCRNNIDDFIYEDFELSGYTHEPAIKGDISI